MPDSPNATTTPDPPKPRKARLALNGGPVRFKESSNRPSTLDFVAIAAPAACALAVISLYTLGPLKLLPPAFGRFILTSSYFLVPASILSIPVAGIRLATGNWTAPGQVWMTITLLLGTIATLLLSHLLWAFIQMGPINPG